MIRDGGSGDRGYEEDRVSDAGADTSSSDGSCSTGFHSEESLGLEYGSEGSELSQLLDEEVNRVKQEEENVVENGPEKGYKTPSPVLLSPYLMGPQSTTHFI